MLLLRFLLLRFLKIQNNVTFYVFCFASHVFSNYAPDNYSPAYDHRERVGSVAAPAFVSERPGGHQDIRQRRFK